MMHKALFPLAICASFALTAGPQTAEAAADSYSLYCRGGGNGILHVDSAGGALAAEWRFKQGKARYAIDTLAPGHCTWVDRGFDASEPWKVWWTKKYKWHFLRTTKSSGTFKMSLRHAKTGKATVPKELQALNALHSANKVVEFRVHAETVERRSTAGKKYADKLLVVDDFGVILQVAPSNAG